MVLFSSVCWFKRIHEATFEKQSFYKVYKAKQPIMIDGDWNKLQWKDMKPIEIKNQMGAPPKFIPTVQAKMMYDKANLYVIFKVRDCFVRCITKDYNGPVWEDSCVEFFFSPDTSFPERYFNLEINCGGTPLMRYNIFTRKEFILLDIDDIKEIEIAHSMPQIVDPEITEIITWTVECKIPIKMLNKYTSITQPRNGIIWRANFYKIAENSSNPHYLTWSVVENHEPNFHLPQFFGMLQFQ
jgi:hypothetical protein